MPVRVGGGAGGAGGGGASGQLVVGDAPRVPVGPEDAVGLDVQVHGVDAHVGVALERLLVAPVGHAGVQAADLVVVGDVQHLSAAVEAWERRGGYAWKYVSSWFNYNTTQTHLFI